MPAIASKATDGQNPAVAVQGPGNSLDFYWNFGGTGTARSVSAVRERRSRPPADGSRGRTAPHGLG
ncbi:MAG: hypothetical protein JF886_01065 [Candidatus Dormibacteraeota bacterium]|uniref:Uncharacterized protein n=1 Tax=Candidatus Aeolococcus gillhamiae TaxID=3127015 RepID=A0A934K065_9BACT|nr:hypothetical protein [Candidatus Dormibacteraeota bacterium]